MSYVCVSQPVWLIYRFKVIDSLTQDVGSEVRNKQTGLDPIIRTVRPQQRDRATRHSLFTFTCNHGFVKECSAWGRYFVWVLVRMVCEVLSGYICESGEWGTVRLYLWEWWVRCCQVISVRVVSEVLSGYICESGVWGAVRLYLWEWWVRCCQVISVRVVSEVLSGYICESGEWGAVRLYLWEWW
jgi:hypothetical protein